MNLAKEVKTYCREKGIFSSADKVIVGVSGGADSVSLCHILVRLRHEWGLDLIVAHFNHRLRKGAKADENYVKRLAASLNLPCYTGVAKTRLETKQGSLEENARKARLSYLSQLAKKLKADCVALAHTEDDLAETVLMRILRGGGTKGLSSILPKRKLEGVNFVRPLLSSQRKEILQFLKLNGFKYRHDPSNKQKEFLRNKIRLDLLPLLENKYNLNIKEVLVSLADNASVDYDFLQTHARKTFQRIGRSRSARSVLLDTKSLKNQHPSIQRLIVRLAIEKLKGDMRQLSFKHLGEVNDLIYSRPTGSIVNLPNKVAVKKSPTNIKLYISKT